VPNKTILFNATTIIKGGGIQAAVAIARFVFSHSCSIGSFNWIFAVSAEVRDELASFGVQLRENCDICLEASPAKNRISRRVLREFAAHHADVVFTFFGPAYVKFDKPHVCGVADGWVTHSTKLAFSTLPGWYQRLHMLALCSYKAMWLRHADAWVVEQDTARQGLISRLLLPKERIFVVENNCSQTYLDAPIGTESKPLHSPVKILTFAAYYPNKGLKLIPHIIFQLINHHNITDVRFVLTIPESQYQASEILMIANRLGVSEYIQNIGPVKLLDGPSLYAQCDITLLPSVLETFSATYPESMHMGLPIITSDMQFARNVCADAALYFEPMNAADAAAKLAKLINSPDRRRQLAAEGFNRSVHFPSPEQRYSQYAAILQTLIEAPK